MSFVQALICLVARTRDTVNFSRVAQQSTVFQQIDTHKRDRPASARSHTHSEAYTVRHSVYDSRRQGGWVGVHRYGCTCLRVRRLLRLQP